MPGISIPKRRYAIPVVLVVAGMVVGLLVAWFARDPHVATPERRTGTVVWSNQDTRLIAFAEDGEREDTEGDQTFYSVVAEDVSNYPSCLTGTPGNPVRQDTRRIEVWATDIDHGGPQKTHLALSVRCLN